MLLIRRISVHCGPPLATEAVGARDGARIRTLATKCWHNVGEHPSQELKAVAAVVGEQ
jgi:hypothetical protein